MYAHHWRYRRYISKASSGVLALSGTGALTASIKNRRIIKRFDGLGWVLGDIGSGLWFGHQALISCASDLDGTDQHTYLTDLIIEKIQIERSSQSLIATVSDQPAAYWAQFTPLVFEAFAAGDDQAKKIVSAGVTRFTHTISLAAASLRETDDATTPPPHIYDLVWAGGVASHTVFPDLVEAQLAQTGMRFQRL
ncbi:MAG: BadF/BadG/BcrA/BcrD ATPase family protein, partial [Arcanobacterium sp.]|nr:BadF/BadG/BcrA/BcrD ATPase family protein [Arcanobacterium sp.]